MMLFYSAAELSRIIVLPLIGWVYRALKKCRFLNASMSDWASSIDSDINNHCTPSEQGGVVSDPG